MNFGGGDIPRDANMSAVARHDAVRRVARQLQRRHCSTSAPAAPSNFIARSGSANLDAPQMQWTDAAGRALGQQYHEPLGRRTVRRCRSRPTSRSSISRIRSGAGQNDLQSLLNTDALGLQTAGISMDSVTRLRSILGRAHVPATVGAVPSSRYTDQALVLGSFDFTPPSSTTGQAFNLTYNGQSWNPTGGRPVSPTELPAHSGDRTNWNGGLQGRHTNYFGFGVLSETSFGVSENRNYGDAVSRSAERVGARQLDVRGRDADACRRSGSAAIRS